jgi:hypothetical protein
MSDLNQINDALDRIFNKEGKRIVFWNDPEREFLDLVSSLPSPVVSPPEANRHCHSELEQGGGEESQRTSAHEILRRSAPQNDTPRHYLDRVLVYCASNLNEERKKVGRNKRSVSGIDEHVGHGLRPYPGLELRKRSVSSLK